MAIGDTISFDTTEIPTEFPGADGIPVADTEPTSDDPTCVVCGTPLTYSGRGRKPKYCDEHKTTRSTSTTRRGSADVELAVQTLHGLYEGLGMPLTLLSPPGGAEWYSQIDGLDARNRLFLATNKDLVKRINAMANKGGNFAFVFSHILAIAPVVQVVRQDFAERAAKRDAELAAQETQQSYQDQAGGF